MGVLVAKSKFRFLSLMLFSVGIFFLPLGIFFECLGQSLPPDKMTTMPGLPTRPCTYDIDLNLETEEVQGLF